jgi:hypothetical protein
MALTLRTLPARAAAAALLLGLVACGDAAQSPLSVVGRTIFNQVRPDTPDTPPVSMAVLRQQLTPEVLAAIDGPLLLAESLRRPGAYPLTRVGRGNGTDIWRAGNNVEYWLTEQGLLVGTRGFGFDLMAADVSETAAALAARRPGPVMRMHMYVDGDWQSEQVFIDCVVSFEGARATELCEVDGERFENIYQLGAGGRVVASVQWGGPEIGLVNLERFR